MAFKCPGENLGSLYTKIYSAPFNCGDSGLRNAGYFCKFILAKLLQFTHNPDGLSGEIGILDLALRNSLIKTSSCNHVA